MGWCGMIPVGSLIGSIMQCIGIAMFCSSAVLGFNELLQLFASDPGDLQVIVDEDYVYYIEIAVYTWAAFMMLWAVGFLFHAFLISAQTSSKMAHEGGTVCCTSLGCVGTALFFNYVFMMLWVAILGAASLLFTFSLMISGYDGLSGDLDPKYVDFTYYGLNINETVAVDDLESISGNMILFFSLMVGGSALVIFGLVNSIASMSSNWMHLKVGDQWKDYAQKRKQEERELHEMTSYKSSERLAQSLYY